METRKELTCYFPHDSNARNSDKLIRLRMRHKAAGYGVFFMILERLREEPDYMSVKDYNMIAFDLREDASLIKSVIEDFGLFVFTEDGKYFYSESFKQRMGFKDEKSRKRSEAGRLGMAKRWWNNNAITKEHNEDNNVITKEEEIITSKRKERKVKKNNNIPPTPLKGNFDLSFVREDFIEIFKNWLDYKIEIKNGYKSVKSVELCYKKLLKLSDGYPEVAKSIVEQSISNNWKGLFELKEEKNGNKNRTNNSTGDRDLGKFLESIASGYARADYEERKG